jgi:hypothetical protein
MERFTTLPAVLLAPLLSIVLAAQGCESSGPAPARRGSRVARSVPEVVAAVKEIHYDDMMVLGTDALSEGRYRAAAQYFGAALSLRPGSGEARDGYARARVLDNRTKRPADLSEWEVRLPVPPAFIQRDLEEKVRSLESEEDRSVILGPDARRGELPEGEAKGLFEPRDPDLVPRPPDENKGERPFIDRPSVFTSVGTKPRLPCDPLRTGRNNLFHSLFHIPAFEGARTLPEKTWLVESGVDVSWGNMNRGTYGYGLYLRYDDNRYDEGFLEVAHGFTEDIEARVDLTFGNLREGNYDIYVTQEFTPYILPYDRRADLGNVILSLKTRPFRPYEAEPETGIASEIAFKIPVASNPKNLTTSGMPDLCAQLVGSLDLRRYLYWPRIVGHVSVGATYPFGEIVFDNDVNLRPILNFGLGACVQLHDLLAVVAQLEGNTSAFPDFNPLHPFVLNTHVGARALLGNFIVEAGVGQGLSRTASTFTVTLCIGLRFMGSEIKEEILR